MVWTLAPVSTDVGTVGLPVGWRLRPAPGRGVLVHALAPAATAGVGICVLRPVPAVGPVPDALSATMTWWEEAEHDATLAANYRRLTVLHCGREQLREEWEWSALLLRCVCPADRFGEWTELFAEVARSVQPRRELSSGARPDGSSSS